MLLIAYLVVAYFLLCAILNLRQQRRINRIIAEAEQAGHEEQRRHAAAALALPWRGPAPGRPRYARLRPGRRPAHPP